MTNSSLWFAVGLMAGAGGGAFLGRFIAKRVKL
jgi:hypothetical protein